MDKIKQEAAHPSYQPSAKTKAALIGHVLRAYTAVMANVPVCIAKEYEYLYDHDNAGFISLVKPNNQEIDPPGKPDSSFKPFLAAAKDQFSDLQTATDFKYNWDSSKFEQDHVVESKMSRCWYMPNFSRTFAGHVRH